MFWSGIFDYDQQKGGNLMMLSDVCSSHVVARKLENFGHHNKLLELAKLWALNKLGSQHNLVVIMMLNFLVCFSRQWHHYTWQTERNYWTKNSSKCLHSWKTHRRSWWHDETSWRRQTDELDCAAFWELHIWSSCHWWWIWWTCLF